MEPKKIEKIINLCKRRGFVFPASGIYDGLTGFFDYGPYGVEMKNNLKKLCWEYMVRQRKNVVGIDGAVVTHPRVWMASGHLENFTDPLVEDKVSHKRFRADHLVEDWSSKHSDVKFSKAIADMDIYELTDVIRENNIKSPDGNELTDVKTFNMMMSTELGVVENEKNIAYLRGEACQSIYLDYDYIVKTGRVKIPFGIAQIGKAFRNEITPKNFLFRQKEFEQWDLQYFVAPNDMTDAYEYWKNERMNWHKKYFNNKDDLRFRQHSEKELVFYAKIAFDIEYNSPMGWREMEGIHWRGDWDLSRHGEYANIDFTYTDPKTNEKYIPNIVETSGGVDRMFLFLLLDAYTEEEAPTGDGGKEIRAVLKLHPKIAPVTVAVLPLMKKDELVDLSNKVFDTLVMNYSTEYDEAGSIGKRYRRQDEIGTPFCVTIDYDSLKDNTVTIRDRDTMAQVRIKIEELEEVIRSRVSNYK